jgi:hypothetical protein
MVRIGTMAARIESVNILSSRSENFSPARDLPHHRKGANQNSAERAGLPAIQI